MSEMETEKVDKLTNPDPFAFARGVHERLHGGCACEALGGLRYLWVYLAKQSPSSVQASDSTLVPLTLQDWLNVVDEAASIGVTGLVISTQDELSANCDAWEICRWAQGTHGMTIGLHVFSDELAEPVLNEIRSLDLKHFFLFAAENRLESLSCYEREGIKVRVAEGGPSSPSHTCTMPSSLVFVNPSGQLYTCGMVEGKEQFLLGHVFEGYFKKILQDPALPHAVPFASQDVKRGCEGCPPLISRQIPEF